MRDVVIIGGGLSGLVAAHVLEQHNIFYTLIEVKPQLGGSFNSVPRAGFTLDSGMMVHSVGNITVLHDYLHTIGLDKTFSCIDDDHIAFNSGNQTLIDTLTAGMNAPVMSRMAVSTLGFLDENRLSICMENGMLLDTRALIVAAPARYTERMFHTMIPEISYRLLDYRYDTITRVSVGYKDTSLKLNTAFGEDYPITDVQTFTHKERGGTVAQVSLRYTLDDLPDDPAGRIAALMGWPLNPDADLIAYWPEADPIMWRDPAHSRTIEMIQSLLPDNVALIGGDYIPARHAPYLDERIQQGIDAANKIIAYLQ